MGAASKQQKRRCRRFLSLDDGVPEKAKTALYGTMQQLDVLKKHNVVDAEGQGFVFFLEGILHFLKERDLRKLLRYRSTKIEPVSQYHALETIDYRYCTEALIEGNQLDKNTVRERLKNMGNSLVIAGSRKKTRIHIHTDEPAETISRLKDLRALPFQKVDDMLRQYETINRRQARIVLVTDSVCDLPQELMDRYQVHMVPINLHFGNSTYCGKQTITPAQFYKMLDEEKEFPTISQTGLTDLVSLYRRLATYYDSIIAIHLAKKLSGTCNVSQTAAETVRRETGKNITVIDSHHLSGSLGLIVLRAA
jgi:uncharacterized protein